jgi:hypothetical protein
LRSFDLDQTARRGGQATLRILVNDWAYLSRSAGGDPGTATINLWVLSIVVLAVILGETARAGLTVDVTKVTCRRASFIGSTTMSANSVAPWLVGYYSGQH